MSRKTKASEEKVEDKITRPQRIRRPKSGSSRDQLGISREEQDRIYARSIQVEQERIAALSEVTRISSAQMKENNTIVLQKLGITQGSNPVVAIATTGKEVERDMSNSLGFVDPPGNVNEYANPSGNIDKDVNRLGYVDKYFNPPGNIDKDVNRLGYVDEYANPSGNIDKDVNRLGYVDKYFNPPGYVDEYVNPLGYVNKYVNPPGYVDKYVNPPGYVDKYVNPLGYVDEYVNPPKITDDYVNAICDLEQQKKLLQDKTETLLNTETILSKIQVDKDKLVKEIRIVSTENRRITNLVSDLAVKERADKRRSDIEKDKNSKESRKGIPT
jgi:hypothetical protein